MATTQLTRKQNSFVDHLVSNPKASATEAAMAAYNTSNRRTAASIASENLTKPNVLAAIDNRLDQANIVEKSVKVISEGLRATKVVHGFVVPDHNVRLKTVDIVLKIKGIK